jgi:hypothetical protein
MCSSYIISKALLLTRKLVYKYATIIEWLRCGFNLNGPMVPKVVFNFFNGQVIIWESFLKLVKIAHLSSGFDVCIWFGFCGLDLHSELMTYGTTNLMSSVESCIYLPFPFTRMKEEEKQACKFYLCMYKLH